MCLTGTLEQYDQAVERCESQMKRINQRRAEVSQIYLLVEKITYCSGITQ